MNKLVPGALFAIRAAEEQRLRTYKYIDPEYKPQGEVDTRDTDATWHCVVEGFRKLDPDRRKAALLLERAG